MSEKILKSAVFEVTEKAEDGVVVTFSTIDKDRDKEVLLPKGVILDNFEKNPIVLTDHTYKVGNAVGKALWVKPTEKGVRAKVKFASTPYAQDVKTLVEEGVINALSHTFYPLEFVDTPEEIKSLGFDPAEVGRVYTKWELLEISFVTLPANPNALVERDFNLQSAYFKSMKEKVEKGEELNPEEPVTEEEEKGAIPYSKLPLADINYRWDKAKALKRIQDWALKRDGSLDPAKLQKCFRWYNTEKPTNITSYKLPIADIINGEPHKVWNAVRAAMAALLGARGGINVPDADKKKIYNALSKDYKDFDKEPPEFRLRSIEEIVQEGLPELYEAIDMLSMKLSEIEATLNSVMKRYQEGNEPSGDTDEDRTEVDEKVVKEVVREVVQTVTNKIKEV